MEPRIGGQARTSEEELQLLQALTLMDLSRRLREGLKRPPAASRLQRARTSTSLNSTYRNSSPRDV